MNKKLSYVEYSNTMAESYDGIVEYIYNEYFKTKNLNCDADSFYEKVVYQLYDLQENSIPIYIDDAVLCVDGMCDRVRNNCA